MLWGPLLHLVVRSTARVIREKMRRGGPATKASTNKNAALCCAAVPSLSTFERCCLGVRTPSADRRVADGLQRRTHHYERIPPRVVGLSAASPSPLRLLLGLDLHLLGASSPFHCPLLSLPFLIVVSYRRAHSDRPAGGATAATAAIVEICCAAMVYIARRPIQPSPFLCAYLFFFFLREKEKRRDEDICLVLLGSSRLSCLVLSVSV